MAFEVSKSDSAKASRVKVFLVALACITALIVAASGFFRSYDRDLSAFRFAQFPTPASQDIIFLGIDKTSLDAVGVWPWPRSVHAEVVDQLVAADVAEIAIDIDFSSSSTPDEDARFAESIKRAEGRVILPTFLQNARLGDASSGTIISKPIDQFAENAWLGSVNVFPETDGKIWSFAAGQDEDGNTMVSMPSMLAERADIENVQLDFGIDAKTIPVLSVAELLDPNFELGSLAGNKVVYGAYATELGDIFLAPVYGPMPGAMLQILAAETLLAEREITTISPVFPLGIIILSTITLALLLRNRWGLWMCSSLLSALVLEVVAVALYKLWAFELATASAHVFIICSILWRYVALNNLITKLMHAARADARVSRGQIEFLSTHDEDTGALRRGAFLEQCEAHIRTSAVTSGIAVFELTRMDIISTALGHERADQTALIFYNRLQLLSPSPIAICRLGPFSFSVVFSVLSEDKLPFFAKQMLDQLSKPFAIGETTISPNVKAGFTRYKNPTGNYSEASERMLVDAQAALNFAVQSGTKDLVIFDNKIDRQMRRNAIIEADLRAAIENDALELRFQPLVDLTSNDIVAFESLLRWQHPELDRVPPSEFVPIADAAGYALIMDEYVLRKACKAAQRLPETVAVSVNIGPRHFEQPGLADLVFDILRETGLSPKRLILEVLETAALGDASVLDTNVNRLREKGIAIALDDFGTGNASFEHLARFPFDKVKLDRAFVQDVGLSKSKQAIVQATRKLCDTFGSQMICEGIETDEDRSLVKLMGCDVGQGYLFAKPLTLDEAVISLAREPKSGLAAKSA